jgi:hypothetical protein
MPQPNSVRIPGQYRSGIRDDADRYSVLIGFNESAIDEINRKMGSGATLLSTKDLYLGYEFVPATTGFHQLQP